MAKERPNDRMTRLEGLRDKIERQGLQPGQWLHQEIARLKAKIAKAQGR